MEFKLFELDKKYAVYKNGDIINTKTGKKVIGTKVGKYRQIHTSVGRFYIHFMVAYTWIKNPENKPEIHHKDMDTSNNSVDNLEWVTRKEHQKLHGMKPVRCIETG